MDQSYFIYWSHWKKIQICETLSIVRFAKIDTEIPDIDIAMLNKDQQYLLLIVNVIYIKSGIFPSDLSNRDPGPLNLSRWLTTANRILRLYVSTAKPSANLEVFTNYIMKVYAQTWFRIKVHHSLKNESRNLHFLICKSRYLFT